MTDLLNPRDLGTDQDTSGTHSVSVVADPLPADQEGRDIQPMFVGGDPLGTDQPTPVTHRRLVGAETLLPADQGILDTHRSSVGGDLLDPGQNIAVTHLTSAGVDLLPADQSTSVTHGPSVGGDLLGTDHRSSDTHARTVGADPSPPDPKSGTTPKGPPGRADVLLLIYADALDDLERVRIATENRVRSLVQIKGMDGTPEHARLTGMVDAIAALEHDATLQLGRAVRTHPLGPWVKRTVGVGEKQGGRLLAAIGDPASRTTVSQLWAYCGYHVLPDGRSAARRKGQLANWNVTAKMRAYLVAEAAVKAGVRKVGDPDDTDGYMVAAREAITPLGETYLEGRAKYADAVHRHPCTRCGPAGKPAEAGSPLSGGHQHARSLRLVAKEILKELWREARWYRAGDVAALADARRPDGE